MAHSNARKKLIRLIQKKGAGKASPEEEQFLEAYYNSFDATGEQPQVIDDHEKEALGREMKADIWQQIAQAEQQRKTIPIIKRTWFRFAVAALVVLAFIPVYYFVIKTPAPKGMMQTTHQSTLPAHDALPGGNKALLTLADGSVIVLDSAKNGLLQSAGNTTIMKQEGTLTYRSGTSAPLGEITYNTLSTPHGGQYHLELPDGSKVWLNAASSIRYPTVFNGNEREVELTGEAYFEIRKNHDKPFRVHFTSPSTDGEGREGMIEVLGTHFNVNAYPDETVMKTTLLEGKVKVSSMVNDQWSMLQPGQQAAIHHARLTIHDVDTEEAVAWKNGLFYFDNVDIQAIMRQLARWYKVQVVFKGKIPARRFAGQVSRSANLSQVLKILALSKVHFTIEDDIVTVLP
jgi:hypothetical protein